MCSTPQNTVIEDVLGLGASNMVCDPQIMFYGWIIEHVLCSIELVLKALHHAVWNAEHVLWVREHLLWAIEHVLLVIEHVL